MLSVQISSALALMEPPAGLTLCQLFCLETLRISSSLHRLLWAASPSATPLLLLSEQPCKDLFTKLNFHIENFYLLSLAFLCPRFQDMNLYDPIRLLHLWSVIF